ncbi:pyruvate formate lyase activating enzyme [Xylaria sp. FL0043]|nr:pyruvate formate lyase activating enzyme [Xylaria sp. FL0043]
MLSRSSISSMQLRAIAAFGCTTRPVLTSRPGITTSASIGIINNTRINNNLTKPWQRNLHLAPPFLLDDYIPRYQQLSEVDAAKKRSLAYAHLQNCNLCPRLCGVNRYETTGMCLIGENVKVNVIAPHFEPCIQGHNGSGAVFFSGCNLRCTFCQNHEIAHQRAGFDLTPEDLAQWYLKLQDVGQVHNINLVTPEHVVPQVALSILHARTLGLRLPIVYNTSAFDSLASLELLDGLVDIYMPDFKVWSAKTSKRLLKADDYAAAATESIRAMHAQVGDLCFTPDGIAKQGLLVRHLVMPGQEDEAREIVRFIAKEVSRDTFVNIMEQYRPDAHVGKKARRRAKKGAEKGSSNSEGEGAGAGGEGKGEGEGEGNAVEEVRYAEINRPVTSDEVSAVRKAAEAVGLWRFCDPPRHDGFAI